MVLGGKRLHHVLGICQGVSKLNLPQSLRDLGYGIENVLTAYRKKFWKKQEKCLEMTRTNQKGECMIEKDILKYRNYSIEEKKGLYIVSQKKYQLIRIVEPALYPIGKRDTSKPYIFIFPDDELLYFRQSSDKAYKKLTQNNKPPTRYQVLFRIMKNLHKYFNNPNKLTFDIKRPTLIFE